MDPFTLALLGGSALASGGLSYMGSKQAAGAQQQAAQQSGMLGLIAQQQAQEQARQMAEKGAAAGREYYDKGRADLLAQGKLGAETAREFYGQGVGFQEPSMAAGNLATNRMLDILGLSGNTGAQGYNSYNQPFTAEDFNTFKDPGYNFRVQQGQQAMLNAARGGGLAGSGAALKAATKYGQEMGSQEFQNAYTRATQAAESSRTALLPLMAQGLTASQTASQLAGTTGGQLSGNQFGLGTNLGSLASNTGNTIAGAYTGAIPTMAALTSANPYGQAMENVGQARASGYVGGASALGQALQGPANAMMAYTMMNRFAPQNRYLAPAGGATATNYFGPNGGYELNY